MVSEITVSGKEFQFHPETSLFFFFLFNWQIWPWGRKKECNHNFYGMKRAFRIKSFGSDWKNKHLSRFCFNFVQRFVDLFVPKAIERKDEVRVNLIEIIFQCIVLFFAVSSVFYSRCQIDQTSAAWLKYTFLKPLILWS